MPLKMKCLMCTKTYVAMDIGRTSKVEHCDDCPRAKDKQLQLEEGHDHPDSKAVKLSPRNVDVPSAFHDTQPPDDSLEQVTPVKKSMWTALFRK
jgi:hypothetical protein